MMTRKDASFLIVLIQLKFIHKHVQRVDNSINLVIMAVIILIPNAIQAVKTIPIIHFIRMANVSVIACLSHQKMKPKNILTL